MFTFCQLRVLYSGSTVSINLEKYIRYIIFVKSTLTNIFTFNSWGKHAFHILFSIKLFVFKIDNVYCCHNYMSSLFWKENVELWVTFQKYWSMIRSVFITIMTQWVPLAEQELSTLSWAPGFTFGFYWGSCCKTSHRKLKIEQHKPH